MMLKAEEAPAGRSTQSSGQAVGQAPNFSTARPFMSRYDSELRGLNVAGQLI